MEEAPGTMKQVEKEWRFPGTPWEFIQMVRKGCVVYEYVHQRKKGVLNLLMDKDAYLAATEETGITYEVVKEVMRRELAAADHIDQLMEDTRSLKKGEK